MKKFFSRFALLGLFAAAAATSYALPTAAAAPADAHSSFQGDSNDGIIIIVVGDDYYVVLVYIDMQANSMAPGGALGAAASDAMFDAQ